MPAINLQIHPAGPLLQAFIGVSAPRGVALQSAGLTLPAPVVGTFLLDTGASHTCVDPDFIVSLGLQPTGQTGISTPSTGGTPHACDQFDISIFIPNGALVGHLITALPVIATHLRSQGIDGLIGRDILNTCALIYNGPAGFFTLAY